VTDPQFLDWEAGDSWNANNPDDLVPPPGYWNRIRP